MNGDFVKREDKMKFILASNYSHIIKAQCFNKINENVKTTN